jgi:hypothetical protein
MIATRDRFAQRCLPLLTANQAGWFVLNSHRLVALWTGGDSRDGLRIEYRSGTPPYPAVSHFGYGILTWTLPYLFRTSPGYNLLVRGPSNSPKEGVTALDGLVETDWSPATFTMNWKLTRVGFPISFEESEPICMLVPQKRGELERFEPRLLDLADDPALSASHANWVASRSEFLQELPIEGSPARQHAWQKDYFRGQTVAGERAPAHQTRLDLHEFAEFPPSAVDEPSDDVDRGS